MSDEPIEAQLPQMPAGPLAPGEPDLPGPFPVGRWAEGFRGFLRGRPRLRLVGEVTNYRGLRSPAIYFELRDGDGAVPCSMWRTDYDKLDLPEGALRDGVELVLAGGPEYFPGGRSASPRFNFRVSYMRPAGEGDLLARLAELRRRLAAEGLFEPQKQLRRPALPRRIGLVTGADSAARADVFAGLERRSWRGELVCAHPPVQGKSAAPKITAAIRDLAAIESVETIIVARGGGSLMDLWAFCDEALCRTVALLRVPVIAAIGHESDTTLIDDVAALACSTPTHAAESAIGLDVARARAELGLAGARVGIGGRNAVSSRARVLGTDARALAHHTERQRARLHQQLREVRAASGRAVVERGQLVDRFGLVLARSRRRAVEVAVPERSAAIDRIAATLVAHDPDRVLERGYAIVSDSKGEVLGSAAEARRRGRLSVRFADDSLEAEVIDDGD